MQFSPREGFGKRPCISKVGEIKNYTKMPEILIDSSDKSMSPSRIGSKNDIFSNCSICQKNDELPHYFIGFLVIFFHAFLM